MNTALAIGGFLLFSCFVVWLAMKTAEKKGGEQERADRNAAEGRKADAIGQIMARPRDDDANARRLRDGDV